MKTKQRSRLGMLTVFTIAILIITLCMCMSMGISGTAYATDGGSVGLTLNYDESEIGAGDFVSGNLALSTGNNVQGLQLRLYYDTNIINNLYYSGTDSMMLVNVDATAGHITFAYGDTTSPMQTNETIPFIFKINGGVSAGTYDIFTLTREGESHVNFAEERVNNAPVRRELTVQFNPLIVGEPSAIMYGDVNGDGMVGIDDSILVLRHVAGLDTLSYEQLLLANVNTDNVVNVSDATAIQEIVAGRLIVLGRDFTVDFVNNGNLEKRINVEIGTPISSLSQYVSAPIIDGVAGEWDYADNMEVYQNLTVNAVATTQTPTQVYFSIEYMQAGTDGQHKPMDIYNSDHDYHVGDYLTEYDKALLETGMVYTDSQLNTLYTEVDAALTGDLTLYMRYVQPDQPVGYTVTIEIGDLTDIGSYTSLTYEDVKAALYADFKFYDLVGIVLYTDSSCTTLYMYGVELTQDITLYAGSVSSTPIGSSESLRLTEGCTIGFYTKLAPFGDYEFYKDASGLTLYDDTHVITKGDTIYTKLAPVVQVNLTINIIQNGELIESAVFSCNLGESFSDADLDEIRYITTYRDLFTDEALTTPFTGSLLDGITQDTIIYLNYVPAILTINDVRDGEVFGEPYTISNNPGVPFSDFQLAEINAIIVNKPLFTDLALSVPFTGTLSTGITGDTTIYIANEAETRTLTIHYVNETSPYGVAGLIKTINPSLTRYFTSNNDGLFNLSASDLAIINSLFAEKTLYSNVELSVASSYNSAQTLTENTVVYIEEVVAPVVRTLTIASVIVVKEVKQIDSNVIFQCYDGKTFSSADAVEINELITGKTLFSDLALTTPFTDIASLTAAITQNISIYFEEPQYAITITPNLNGSITDSNGADINITTVVEGDWFNCNVTPNAGWIYSSVAITNTDTGDVIVPFSESKTGFRFYMPANNITITVIYVEGIVKNGTLVIGEKHLYYYDDSNSETFTLTTISPVPGITIIGWYDNAELTGTPITTVNASNNGNNVYAQITKEAANHYVSLSLEVTAGYSYPTQIMNQRIILKGSVGAFSSLSIEDARTALNVVLSDLAFTEDNALISALQLVLYTDEAFTLKYVYGTAFTEDTTLYIATMPMYLKFSGNSEVEQGMILEGTPISALVEAFGGEVIFSRDANGTVPYSNDYVITKEDVIYATLTPEGAFVILNVGNEFDYISYEISTELPTGISLGSIANMTFVGWYDNPEFKGNSVTTVSAVDSGKEYYAKYKQENGTHRVTLSYKNISALEDATTELFVGSFTRINYSYIFEIMQDFDFLGNEKVLLYTDAECTTLYNFDTVLSNDITLHIGLAKMMMIQDYGYFVVEQHMYVLAGTSVFSLSQAFGNSMVFYSDIEKTMLYANSYILQHGDGLYVSQSASQPAPADPVPADPVPA